ncbi:hypothetical protein [Blastococcus sp. URHD0036]|nr:hypothetical protein [Blastococcus sp. URHD0036]
MALVVCWATSWVPCLTDETFQVLGVVGAAIGVLAALVSLVRMRGAERVR